MIPFIEGQANPVEKKAVIKIESRVSTRSLLNLSLANIEMTYHRLHEPAAVRSWSIRGA
jgi:hypothetical protein